MTTVLVTSIGSSPAIDLARCLRRDPALRVIGADASEWGRRIGERLCDEVVEIPRADRDAVSYGRALDALSSRVDFVFFGLDVEIGALVDLGALPRMTNALPPLAAARIFLDKAATIEAARTPSEFPRTTVVETEDDVRIAFRELAAPVWIRPATGTSGRGSLAARSAEEAWTWIAFWRGRGAAARWTAQEFLPGRNVNWSGLFVRGELTAFASMERLEYFLGDLTLSGVTGQVRSCRTIVDARYADVSQRVIRAIDPRPHGLYSVDLREDADGRPRVTEINPRLAGRPWLYANANGNLPLAAVRALRGEAIGDAMGTFRAGVSLYRQLDVDPLLG